MALPTSRLKQRFASLGRDTYAGFVAQLRRFFGDQAARVLARYFGLYLVVDAVAPQPYAEELLPSIEQVLLWYASAPWLRRASLQSTGLAATAVGFKPTREVDPLLLEQLLRASASMVGGIHRTTLEAIRTTLAEGARRGYTVSQIARGVPVDGFRGLNSVVEETYKNRAETIARTELARTTNLAMLERYQQAGVPMVYVIDGMSPTPCGWLRHDDPDQANDTWRTLIDAQAHPLAHPNCVRRFLPAKPGTHTPWVPPVPTPSNRFRITVSLTAGGRPVAGI